MTAFFIGLDTAIALFKRHRWLLIGIPLAIALAVQTFKLNAARADLLEKQAIISNMKLASEVARQAQITLNAQNAQLAERIADNALAAHAENREAVSRSIADYAASHRMRPVCGRVSGQADPAPVPDHPRAPDSPDGSEVVAVPREEFEQLARDALRGAEARAFLIDLANEGLATVSYPEPAFGK